MVKSDIVNVLVNDMDMTYDDAGDVVNAVFDAIRCSLANGENVAIKCFGTFKIVECAERIARNPQTGEPMRIPKKKRIRFKPSKNIKVN